MRKLPFHPVCFALYPVLSLYSHNLGLFPLSDILRPGAISLLCAAVMWLVAGLILKSVVRGAVVASVAIVLFFTFGYLQIGFSYLLSMFADPRAFLYLWVPLTVGLLILFGWKFSANRGLNRFLNVGAGVLLLLPCVSIATGLVRIHKDVSSAELAASGGSGVAAKGLPDIFYVILDGYGREDELKEYFDFSNAPFIQALQSRGFYIPTKSRSNYCQTELSLSSSLNMDFVGKLIGTIPAEADDRAPLDRLLDQSSVAEFLKTKGYEYIAITSGFPGVHPRSADVLLSADQGYSLFESSLLSSTPFQASPSAVGSQYDSRRDNLLAALQHLYHMGPRGARPRFVFAHILAPHPPFVLGPNGEHVRPTHTVFGYWDASAYFLVGGTQQLYKKGYIDQLQFVNKQMLAIVDQIRKDASVPPIIILQGDHGSRAHLSQDSLAKSDVREVFRNFNSYLVPDAVRSKLYPTITPVNSFRVILDTLFGTKFPLLPDRSYYTTWDHPYEFVDVTDQVEKPY